MEQWSNGTSFGYNLHEQYATFNYFLQFTTWSKCKKNPFGTTTWGCTLVTASHSQQLTGPLRLILWRWWWWLIWHNGPIHNVQLLFSVNWNTDSLSHLLSMWHKFWNWLRTSCVVSITTVANTRTANFWADFKQRIFDMWINVCQGRTLCYNFWHRITLLFREKRSAVPVARLCRPVRMSNMPPFRRSLVILAACSTLLRTFSCVAQCICF